MIKKTRILFLEDHPSDAELEVRELRRAELDFEFQRVETKETFLEALKEFDPDIIISDFGLPQFNGLEALRLVKGINPALPFILCTGTLTEEFAVECMKEGATDYILKTSLKRLPSAVLNGLEISESRQSKEKAIAALRESEERFRSIIETTAEWIWEVDLQDGITYSNPAVENLLGYRPEELFGKNPLDLLVDSDRQKINKHLPNFINNKQGWSGVVSRLRHKDGSIRYTESNSVPILDADGVLTGFRGTDRDITERRKSEQLIAEANEKAFRDYDLLLERIAQLAAALGTAYDLQTIYRSLDAFVIASVPRTGLFISLYDAERNVRLPAYAVSDGEEIDVSALPAMEMSNSPNSRAVLTGSVIIENDFQAAMKDQPVIQIGLEKNPDLPQSCLVAPMAVMGHVIGAVEVQSHKLSAYSEKDATAIRMAANLAANAIENVRLFEQENRIAAQLQQSQKMEAVGTLTGGVAHDFNNLLTAILGNAQLAQRKLAKDDPVRLHLTEIAHAGNRAAELTRKLLAFSRSQHLERRTVNLNDTISEIVTLLDRIIGADVEVVVKYADDLARVLADPAQIEQVVMNLAVNGRDAMPSGGRLTIETSCVDLDESYTRQYPYVVPGRYVQIAVTDSGTGIDAETQARIFDPFFTTKEVGKGTGLGLSMAYGIVKQHDGHINVYSEIGHGTTFMVYIPVAAKSADEVKNTLAAPLTVEGGTETILVAEDEEQLQNLVKDALEALGYAVLLAKDGKEAVEIFTANRGRIDLFLSDVIMPGMGGSEAYERIQQLGGTVPLILMTGYSSETVQSRIVKPNGTDKSLVPVIIQKPYTLDSLGRKVREVLNKNHKS